MSGEPIKQHTVPCSYLQGFWDAPNGRKTPLYMLDVKTGDTISAVSGNMTMEKDFYTIYGKNWEKDYSIEKFFGAAIESKIPWLVQKISDFGTLSKEEIKTLSEFVTFQEMRSTSRRKWDGIQEWEMIAHSIRTIQYNLHTLEEQKQSLARFLQEYFHYTAKDAELTDMISRVENWEKITFESRNQTLAMMLSLAPEMARILRSRQWVFLHSTKQHPFIVSDYPIYLQAISNVPSFWSSPGYATADFISFPISKHCYLMAWDLIWDHQLPHHVRVSDPKIIRMFNGCTAWWTDRWLIGSSDLLLKSIHKYVKSTDEAFDKKHQKKK